MNTPANHETLMWDGPHRPALPIQNRLNGCPAEEAEAVYDSALRDAQHEARRVYARDITGHRMQYVYGGPRFLVSDY